MSIDPAIRAGLAPRRRPGQPSATLDGDYFTLGSAVGPDQPNRREDVIKVETILGATGDYDIERFQGPLGHFGQPQANAVRSWQERNGYKSDATLFRDGPTITGLKRQAGGLLGGLAPPSPAEVDHHHQRLGRGEPGILNTRPARLSIRLPRQAPELDEQTHAFNADTARALTRTSVDGDVPNIYANHLKQAGAAGHATVLDLVEQVTAAEGRDRAERVLHAILGQLPPDQATAFLGGAMPPRRPLGVRDADLPRDDHRPLFARASAAADTEAVRPVQLAQADTGTMTDAAPADHTDGGQAPVQVAAGPAALPLLPLLLGGAAVTGGAIAQQQIQRQLAKPQGQGTTVADPQAAKPPVLTGPDPSTPRQQQATPPSQPPQPIPPLPPSTPQQPTTTGNAHPGRPADTQSGRTIYDYAKLPKPLDHSAGEKPHADTQKGINSINDDRVRQAVGGFLSGGGQTTNADQYGTQVVKPGDFKTIEQDMQRLVEQSGGDPSKVRVEKTADGKGTRLSYDDGRIKIDGRSTSKEGSPTLSVYVPGAAPKGRNYEIKWRYKNEP